MGVFEKFEKLPRSGPDAAQISDQIIGAESGKFVHVLHEEWCFSSAKSAVTYSP